MQYRVYIRAYQEPEECRTQAHAPYSRQLNWLTKCPFSAATQSGCSHWVDR